MAVEENNHQNDGGDRPQVQCVETPDGALAVDIRTLTEDELELLELLPAKPRLAPQRVD